MTGVYTITHEPSGAIRIAMPQGSSLHFSNSTYLAERLVEALNEAEILRDWVSKIRKAAGGPLGSDAPPELVRYQREVMKSVNEEIPF